MTPAVTIPAESGHRFRTLVDALTLKHADLAGPVLVVVGQEHRRQEAELFASQGATGPSGRWAALNPSYAKRKKEAFGSRKILQLTGEMKKRFIKAGDPNYVQTYEPKGDRGIYLLGARSSIAAAHFHGIPAVASGSRSEAARRIFGGIAPRLPIRDPMSKTRAQVQEIMLAVRTWYVEKRIPQALRHQGKI